MNMDGRFLLPGTVKQGYLTKSPPLDKGTSVFKAWKKRWCILYLSQRELFIQYYENEESSRGSSPPKSTVSLRFCEKVDVDLEHSHYKNVFGIYLPERVYYFSAPSNYDMNEWVDAICTHLNLRDKSDPQPANNIYSVSQAAPTSVSPSLSNYGTNISPTPPSPFGSSSHYGTNISPTPPSPYGSSFNTLPGTPTAPAIVFPSQYGTLSSVHMGSAAMYGSTAGGRGPPPSPPPPYSTGPRLMSNGIDGGNSPILGFRQLPPSPNLSIQQRSLPPIPKSKSEESFDNPSSFSSMPPPSVPPRRSSTQENTTQEQPPVPPPRLGSAVPNLYASAPRIK